MVFGVPLIALFVQISDSRGAGQANDLARREAEANRPEVHFGSYVNDGPVLSIAPSLYLTNSGRQPISVAGVELIALPYVFLDQHATTTCAAREACALGHLGTFDYVSTKPSSQSRMMMSSAASCEPAPQTLEVGGGPLAFSAPTRSVVTRDGQQLYPANFLLPSILQQFRVRIHFMDGSQWDVDVTPARDADQTAVTQSLEATFSTIIMKCAPRVNESAVVASGTPFEKWLSQGNLVRWTGRSYF